MDALVLSGGSVKGCWQAGAIAEVLATGFAPGIITGTSVGALNTAYMAAHQPQHHEEGYWGWNETGEALIRFWETEVTGPGDVGGKRDLLALAWRIWRKKWAGLIHTTELKTLVHDTLGPYFPVSGIQARVCSVNLRTGAKVYTGSDEPHFLDAVLASAAEPFLMPAIQVQGDTHVDGGLAEIAPLAEAIRLGATRIVCVVCQPEQVAEVRVNWGDTCALVGRLTTIVGNEIVNNDLARCREINDAIRLDDAHPGKRIIDLTVIRPAKELPIALDRFTSADIRAMVAQGRADARGVLALDKAA